MNDMDIIQAAQGVAGNQPANDSLLFGMSVWGFVAGLIFSGIGFIYFRYGKSSGDWKAMLAGIALLVYPYFVQNTAYIIVAGLGIMAAHKIAGKFL